MDGEIEKGFALNEAVPVYSDALDKLHERYPEAAYWIHEVTQRLLDAMRWAGL